MDSLRGIGGAAALPIDDCQARRETENLRMQTHRASEPHGEKETEGHAWQVLGPDFVLVQQAKPPPRIEPARERMLLSRLYLGLIRSMIDDYGAEFTAHQDSSSLRTIGIYVFFRTVICSPVPPGKIAQVLKMRRSTVLRRLQELVKTGHVERVGNAYRVTDKVNIPDLKEKLQRRIEMIVETARKLSELTRAERLEVPPPQFDS
jgi:predicted transcriptional regulator